MDILKYYVISLIISSGRSAKPTHYW